MIIVYKAKTVPNFCGFYVIDFTELKISIGWKNVSPMFHETSNET
jgi:hypothetical protein